jgi:BioD-like phosphotransacetylase family protein
MAANTLQTSKELQQQILKTKTEEPHNYKKIQRLQQLLDKIATDK